jgi:hypothetical protein
MKPQIYKDLSWQERKYIREEYTRHQDGLCYHCKEKLTAEPKQDKWIDWKLFPRGIGFLQYPVHLHHDHKTGLTIGAVHAYCNAVLWQYHGE